MGGDHGSFGLSPRRAISTRAFLARGATVAGAGAVAMAGPGWASGRRRAGTAEAVPLKKVSQAKSKLTMIDGRIVHRAAGI